MAVGTEGQARPDIYPQPFPKLTREYIGRDGGYGLLSLVNPLPSDFPADFRQHITRIHPWYSLDGRQLDPDSVRNPTVFEIAGVPLVLKEGAHTIIDLRAYTGEFKRLSIQETFPDAQFAIIEKAKDAYRRATGKELPVEEPIASFVDLDKAIRNRKSYMLFRYYEPSLYPEDNERDQELYKAAEHEAEEVWRTLTELGFSTTDDKQDMKDTVQKIIVASPTERKYIPVLIDTENWKYGEDKITP